MPKRRGTNRSRVAQLTIAIEGDSLALGSGTSDVVAQGAFRQKLMRLINAHLGVPARFVGNQGQAGARLIGTSGLTVAELDATPYAINQLPQWKIDVIFLHIGTNDCTQLNTGGTPLLSTSRAALTTHLDRIRTQWPKCKVYISRIIDNSTAHTEVVNFNAAAIDTDVVARADYIAGLVEIVDEYTQIGLYGATKYQDGSHLNLVGCEERATNLYNAFAADF